MANVIRHTFRTLNNRVHPAQLKPDEMATAQNVDLHDDGRSLSRRGGYALALAGSQHSLWAHPDGSIALCGESSTLKRFWPDATTDSLLSLSTDERLAFEAVNNVVVFTNNTDIGYVQNGEAALFSAPTEQFKLPVPAGRFLGFYKGRLYVLNDDGLYYTDAYTIDQMDERNCLLPLLGTPTLLAAVDDGIWVGKGDKLIWLAGGNPEEMIYVDNAGTAVPGTLVIVDSEQGYGFKTSGKYALWTSDRGICVGANGGKLEVVTQDYLAPKQAQSGTAVLREQNGEVHYLAALQDTSAARNQFTSPSVTVDSQTTGG